MNDYMLLLRGGREARMAMSPEEMQGHMQRFFAWMKGLSANGHLKEGLPLEDGGLVLANNGTVMTDGPFAEGKEAVAGYIILNAESLDQARDMARGCPILELDGGTVEVRSIGSLTIPE